MTPKTIQKAPVGWRFYTADFSLQAAGLSETGRVLLIRSPEEKVRWHQQGEAIKDREDCPPLFIEGEGETFEDAMRDAESKTQDALPIAPVDGERQRSEHCKEECGTEGATVLKRS